MRRPLPPYPRLRNLWMTPYQAMSFLELISEKASYFAPSLRSGIGIPAAKDKIQLLIRAAPPLIEQYHIRQCFPNKVKMCPKKGVQKKMS